MGTIINSKVFRGVSVQGKIVSGLAKNGTVFYKKTPTIASLNITPNTGSAPYVLSAIFTDQSMIDNVVYGIKTTISYLYGSCGVPLFSGDNAQQETSVSLLQTGSYTYTGELAPGYCYVISVFIYRISDNVVVSSATTKIDNL